MANRNGFQGRDERFATDGPHARSYPMENTYPERREIGPRLGGEIDAARRRAGLTFRQAAPRIGISAGYLCELTKGRRCPSTWVAEDIIAELPMTAGAAEELRIVAVERKWPRARRRQI